ncbi:MAG: hypothetical protein ABFS17_13145 [Chloroflexota bacterium]
MKRLIKFKIIIEILLIIFLAGCTSTQISSGEQPYNSDVNEPLEIFSQETNENLNYSENRVPSVEATSTPVQNSYLTEECISMLNVNSVQLTGILTLRSVIDDSQSLINSNTTLVKSFLNTEYTSVSSPDHTRVAYIQKSPRSIVIASNEGVILQKFPIEESWLWLISWVSENQIFLEQRLDFRTSRYEPGRLIVFDLNTGSYNELYPDFPNIVPFVELFPHWVGNMTFMPTPDLKYIVYALKNPNTINNL